MLNNVHTCTRRVCQQVSQGSTPDESAGVLHVRRSSSVRVPRGMETLQTDRTSNCRVRVPAIYVVLSTTSLLSAFAIPSTLHLSE